MARDIHDSVGHKLTALLMQLEVLKQHESGGLPAIMGMLRRLETESFMRIQFTIKDGALSAPLGSVQSIVVYRVVQEALTNAMRHGQGREARIMFEAPGGGSIFRFEVVNERKDNKPFAKGFGLKSMRERMGQAGGQLEITAYNQLFIVRGTLSFSNKARDEA
ncbi:sensor histidine kinase [Bacillus sp. V3-13]|uniref:sensor histidine kinase n=1 Tax=Bacillus sp. V3-13 TaxID=2053728 RepID=UPI0015E0942C|nr:histidine kinase [Bacillus sp. V3-13]